VLGFTISGTPLANVAVNPFASALAGLLFSNIPDYEGREVCSAEQNVAFT
jgi:hypothetical protein